MQLLIEIRTVYGNEAIYPANEAAASICKLTGKKTLSRADLAVAESLGFVVAIKPQSLAA